MKLDLDIDLSKSLRDKVNQEFNFSYKKIGKFKIPGSKRGQPPKESPAYNCLCAAMDRIDDLVEHCNSLEVNQSKKGVFALCDIFNYGQALIDCIEIIASIYEVQPYNKTDCSIFHQPGFTGNGSDEKYFKYLRSLCSVHPTETTGHKEYQGNEPEWCPYIQSGNARMDKLFNSDSEHENSDFYAVVYRNDEEISKHVPIYTAKIFQYLKKRYARINDIIDGIDHYNKNLIASYINKPIAQPCAFANYNAYLKNLFSEIMDRSGNGNYYIKEWAAILETHFDDPTYEEILENYKRAMLPAIARVHNDLQSMQCLCDGWDVKLFNIKLPPDLDGFTYAYSKLDYLCPATEIETNENWIFDFISCKTEINPNRVQALLFQIESAQKINNDPEQMLLFNRYLDQQFSVTDSEWARMQLKTVEGVYKDVFSFDYLQNDWHLWVQIKLAEWVYTNTYNVPHN